MSIDTKKVLDSFGENDSIGKIIDCITVGINKKYIWFRGESEAYKYPACPFMARKPVPNLEPIEQDYNDGSYSFPLRILTKYEDKIIKDLQKYPPSDPYFPKLINKSISHPGWIALAKHHDKETRLLDVTRDLFVALFFACNNHPKKDGYVFVFLDLWNPSEKNPIINYIDLYDAALIDKIPSYRNHDAKNPGTLKKYAHELQQEYLSDKTRKNIPYLFECKDIINERMIAQRGAFVWRGDPGKSIIGNLNNVFAYKIKSNIKQNISDKLVVLGIDANTLKIN